MSNLWCSAITSKKMAKQMKRQQIAAKCLNRGHPLVAITLSLCLLWANHPTLAAIFRTVDAQGNITYTDQAPTAADSDIISEQVELAQPNTFADSTPYERWDPEVTSSDNDTVSYELLIVAPAHDQAIRENTGNVTIRTRIAPELQEGDVARLELNGSLTADPVTDGSIYLNNLPRGTHRARLVVENSKGRRIAESPESVFHLQRFSQLSPAARARRANVN